MLQAYRDSKNLVCGKDSNPLKVVTVSLRTRKRRRFLITGVEEQLFLHKSYLDGLIIWQGLTRHTRFCICSTHCTNSGHIYPFYIFITLHNITEISSLYRISNRIMYPYLYRIDVLIISKLLLANFFRCQLYTIKNKYI